MTKKLEEQRGNTYRVVDAEVPCAEVAVALCEVNLRAAARNYGDYSDLPKSHPDNRRAWVRLSVAAGMYSDAVRALCE